MALIRINTAVELGHFLIFYDNYTLSCLVDFFSITAGKPREYYQQNEEMWILK